VKGYIVVFEGDDESGYSAYSPDLPGVVAAADTRHETESVMVEAMAAHIAALREPARLFQDRSRASAGRSRAAGA
jgi:predicted RNase H-like HicB family nuclease